MFRFLSWIRRKSRIRSKMRRNRQAMDCSLRSPKIWVIVRAFRASIPTRTRRAKTSNIRLPSQRSPRMDSSRSIPPRNQLLFPRRHKIVQQRGPETSLKTTPTSSSTFSKRWKTKQWTSPWATKGKCRRSWRTSTRNRKQRSRCGSARVILRARLTTPRRTLQF